MSTNAPSPSAHDHADATDGGGRTRAAVVTASDGVSHGAREDRSGDALAAVLTDSGMDVERRVLPDDRAVLADAVRDLAGDDVRLVVVTGGTGLGPRDVTPEALADLGGRVLPGFGEVMRATGRTSTPLADLSRSVAVAIDDVLVVAVPGSPSGAVESLDAVLDLVPHALDLLAGDTEHAADESTGGQEHTHDHGNGHGDAHGAEHGAEPAHGEVGHVHDDACATAHGGVEDDDAGTAGTLMAVFASPLSALLVAWGRELGWDTVLVDPRAAGRDGVERHVAGMRVVATTAAADATTDVVVTDHHREELVDLLDTALDTDARFIGLMGSPRHEGPHVAPLRERGRDQDDLDRIVRPIGIDIGSRTPAEIAVSTLADLVRRRRVPSR